MKTIIWIISVVLISLIIGELYYQYLKKKNREKYKTINDMSMSVDNSIDRYMDDLDVEYMDIVPRTELQMRGSWRLAKGKTLSIQQFKQVRDSEYQKKL